MGFMNEQEKEVVESMRLKVEDLLISYDEFGTVSGQKINALRNAMNRLNKVIR
jgi:hypothetical protein